MEDNSGNRSKTQLILILQWSILRCSRWAIVIIGLEKKTRSTITSQVKIYIQDFLLWEVALLRKSVSATIRILMDSRLVMQNGNLNFGEHLELIILKVYQKSHHL